MMLERLQIRNFQCHEDLKVVFDDKVTAIIGPSDVGKSAVLRAFRWVATNRPRGKGFVRKGADEAVVSVWLDGTKVTRAKGRGNRYEVDGIERKAVGSDVPEDIRNVLQVDGMNFQGQHESPFWFDLTGGDLAKRLNAIVDLDVIDKVQSVLLSRSRKANAKKAVVEEQLVEAKEKLEELVFVGEMDKAFIGVEELRVNRQKKAELAEDLRETIRDWVKYQEQIARQENLWLLGVSAVKQGYQAKELREKQERLTELIERMAEAKGRSGIKIPDVSGIHTSAMEAVDKRKKQKRVDGLVQEWSYQRGELQRLMVEQDEIAVELEDKLQGVCPLCGGELKGDSCQTEF